MLKGVSVQHLLVKRQNAEYLLKALKKKENWPGPPTARDPKHPRFTDRQIIWAGLRINKSITAADVEANPSKCSFNQSAQMKVGKHS